MKKAQHDEMIRVLTAIVERNMDSKMTPELATGIVNLMAHETARLVEPEEPETEAGEGDQ